MAEWVDPCTEEVFEFGLPSVEFVVSEPVDEPVLLGPDGEPAWRLTRRLPFGFLP